MLLQNTIKPDPKATKRRKRLGRGRGSGKGNFSGRGVKGQKARSGGQTRPGFQGGQTPLIRRIPKFKGFKNPNKVTYQIVNIQDLNIFPDGTEINKTLLLKHRLIHDEKKPVKLLGYGELKKKIKITVDAMSKSAAGKLGN